MAFSAAIRSPLSTAFAASVRVDAAHEFLQSVPDCPLPAIPVQLWHDSALQNKVQRVATSLRTVSRAIEGCVLSNDREMRAA